MQCTALSQQQFLQSEVFWGFSASIKLGYTSMIQPTTEGKIHTSEKFTAP